MRRRRGTCESVLPCGHHLLYPLSYELSSGRSRTFDRAIRSNRSLHHRQKSWRGTGDAVTALAGERPFGRAGLEPARRSRALPRSNRHLHHRRPNASLRLGTQARWGTFDVGLSVISTCGISFGLTRTRGTKAFTRTSTARSITGGVFTRFPGAKYPKSSPPAFIEPLSRQNTNSVAALLKTRRHSEPLIGSPRHRSPAFASFPPAGPALAARAFPREPGIRVSRSGLRRRNSKLRRGQQKTLRSLSSGGSVDADFQPSLMRGCSHEPGARQQMASSHSCGPRIIRRCLALSVSCFSRTHVRGGAVLKEAHFGCQAGWFGHAHSFLAGTCTVFGSG